MTHVLKNEPAITIDYLAVCDPATLEPLSKVARKAVLLGAVRFILQTTLDAKVPVFTFSTTLVQQGAFGALVVDATDAGRQAGHIGKRLLRKEPIKGPRFVPPEKTEMALNLNVAAYLGLKPSDQVVRSAGKIFSGPGSFAKQEAHEVLIP
jgi:putative tryptophan/tyrosine transport system substrate-binding protein